jgi:hypothetical protein
MPRAFSSSELRTAADQALVLADLTFCKESRLFFIRGAAKLNEEADMLDRALPEFEVSPRSRVLTHRGPALASREASLAAHRTS